jgi:ankyrin repeat protein
MLVAVSQSARGETPTTRPADDFVQLPPGQASVVLPLTHAGAWLCTKVSVDGKDAGWFVVDTGTPYTSVDAENAKQLGLKLLKSVTPTGSNSTSPDVYLTCHELQVGPLTTRQGIVSSVDLGKISSMTRLKIGGLLGGDFFASHPFTLDWRAGTLTVYGDDRFIAPAEVHPQALQLREGLPSAKATVAGFTGWFMLDSGGHTGVTLDSRGRWASVWRAPVEHYSPDSTGNVEGTATGFATMTGPNEILGRSSSALRISCHETSLWTRDFFAGSIGAEYLSQARLTFDYAKGLLWAQWYTDTDKNEWYGDSVDVNRKDLLGRTPLMQAAVDGNERLVEAMIGKGARLNDVDSLDFTALTLAAMNGRSAAVRRLLTAHADAEVATVVGGMRALDAACAVGDLVSVDALLNAGAKVDVTDVYHRTPLMTAARAGYPKVVERLLRSGANVNFGGKDRAGALACAAGYGDAESVAVLLAAGADVNPAGTNPLIWAAGVNNLKVVKLLLEHGAKIDAKDAGGKTPLMRAVENHCTEAVELLLKSGADPKIQTADGHTALDLARDPPIIRALVGYAK